jgi:GT2 family glycosyltransferase
VARVRHRVTADRATWDYFRRRCFAEGRSKAIVAHLAGTDAGLSAEREYTRRILPLGVRRELRRGRGGDPKALLRAGAIVAGLGITASGYLTGRARRLAHTGTGDRASGGPPPERVLAVELSEGVPAVPDTRPAGGRYAGVHVLVRRDARPLGLIHADLPPGGLSSAALAEVIEGRLAGELQEPTPPRPPAAPATDVTVVVPTCGRPELLRRTLDALAGLHHRPRDIVVIDNAPNRPETADVVAGCAAIGVPARYVAEPRRGVAHARNRGLAEAIGELVAFVDDDVVVDSYWLDAVVTGFTDGSTAAVTGYVLPAELEAPAQVWTERYGGFGKGCRRVRFDATGYEVADPGGSRWVPATAGSLYPYLPGTYGSGANMTFRTSILRDLGGFDPVLGSGRAVRAGEDIDVLLRLVLAGHTVIYEPAAIVWHAHRRETPALRRTMYHYGAGLSAVLTKTLLTDAARRGDLLRRIPAGVGYALRPGSDKNAGKGGGYPLSLTALEVLGMASGPVRYAVGRATAALLEGDRR